MGIYAINQRVKLTVLSLPSYKGVRTMNDSNSLGYSNTFSPIATITFCPAFSYHGSYWVLTIVLAKHSSYMVSLKNKYINKETT